MTTTLQGQYLQHYERGIWSKLTEYADKDCVRVKNGSFKATLNKTISDRRVENLVWSLEHVWHTLAVRRT